MFKTQYFFPIEQLNEGLLEGFPGEVSYQQLLEGKEISKVHQKEKPSVVRLPLSLVLLWFVFI